MNFSDLNEYQKNKIIVAARAWRLKNHACILKMIKDYAEENSMLTQSVEPTGSMSYFYEQWDANNWMWFREKILLPLY